MTEGMLDRCQLRDKVAAIRSQMRTVVRTMQLPRTHELKLCNEQASMHASEQASIVHRVRQGRAWEAQAAGDARHNGRDEVVQVAKGRGGQLEGAEADVVQGFIVQDLSRPALSAPRQQAH